MIGMSIAETAVSFCEEAIMKIFWSLISMCVNVDIVHFHFVKNAQHNRHNAGVDNLCRQ